MSGDSTFTRVYTQFPYGDAALQDAAVAGVMQRYSGKLVNVGTVLATKQRDNIYDIPGSVDQLMCLLLEAELTHALGQPVKVTTCFEETDLGQLVPDLVFENDRLE